MVPTWDGECVPFGADARVDHGAEGRCGECLRQGFQVIRPREHVAGRDAVSSL